MKLEMISSTKRIVRWTLDRGPEAADDELAVEEPLEIQVETRPISVTMRTPGHDEELAAGFLITEGVLDDLKQIRAIRPYPRNEKGNAINVLLREDVIVDLARLTRHVFSSSSCGLCGKATIDAIHSHFPPIISHLSLSAHTLRQLPAKMRAAQASFERTGGLHAAALINTEGQLLVLREDIGRHNAVDKVLGHALLYGVMDPSQAILLVSGRASFEILQKSLAGKIPIIAAVSAPSSLAVEFAEASGQTLIGFLREDRFNVYTHAHRIRG